jgi:hypothetical protein
MKKIILTTSLFLVLAFTSFSQQEKNRDTSNLVIGKKVVRIFKENDEIVKILYDAKDSLAYHEVDKKQRKKDSLELLYNKNEGHWQGIDFGTSILLNSNGQTSFSNQKFLENDPSKSFYMNLNLFEGKLPLVKHYVGLTSGLGFNWTSIGIRNSQTLNYNADSVWTTSIIGSDFDQNKLRASYFTVPLFLEFNSNSNSEKSAYFMAGVVGGIRLSSKFIQKEEKKNVDNYNKTKGEYALNPFKLDASVRFGYKSIGAFASYSLLPMFDTKRVEKAYPVSFGLSWVW